MVEPERSPEGVIDNTHSLKTDAFIDVPLGLRERYIRDIKHLRLGIAQGEDRRDLWPPSQSILNLLVTVEVNRHERPVTQAFRELSKVPLLLAVGEEIGHRPEAFPFLYNGSAESIPDAQLEKFLSRYPAMYLKMNRGFKGYEVFRISKKATGYTVDSEKHNGTHLTALSDLSLPTAFLQKEALYIAEAEIPIAKTSGGSTWEIRNIPPFLDLFTAAKVSPPSKVLNNISQGGSWGNPSEVVADVIRVHYPDITDAEVESRTADFLSRSKELSERVKDLTDRFQIEVAKGMIRPEDLKDPSKYDEIMQRCFSGTFFTVDITGVWDKQGNLSPIIVEAQDNAGLPNAGLPGVKKIFLTPINKLANEEAHRSLKEKVSELQVNLK